MSYCSDLESHPNRKLEDHLSNVASISENILKNLCIDDKIIYTRISFFIGICHDFAKSTTFFQEKLKKGFRTENARHGFLSAVFGYHVVRDYIKNNSIETDIDFAIIAFLVILRHHGDLQNIDGIDGEIEKIEDNNRIASNQIKDIINNLSNNPSLSLSSFYNGFGISLENFLLQYDDLIDEIIDALDELTLEGEIENYFLIILFYSVLLDADKMDASGTAAFDRELILGDIVDSYKEKNFGSNPKGINIIREQAYQEVISNILKQDLENRIFSIDLPTGTGKTLIAFSLALKLKEKIYTNLGFNPRIIYSLPFLSIIDQNEKVFSNILDDFNLNKSNIILKHHYLSDMSYTVDVEEDLPIDKSRILVEGWNSEIIVTTFIQFFYSLISNKNKSLRKFHNMSNSIIILDEIQAVPYQYWGVINKMLKILSSEFNSWIILMTATQPLIFSKNEIIPLVENKEYFYKSFDRIDYSFDLKDLEFDEFKDKIIKEIIDNPSKDILVVLNTIKSSKDLYNHIKYYFEENFDNIEVDESGIVLIENKVQLTYLSTNIIPKHRLNKINTIKESKERNIRNIIVSTQLIEAGVDISVDIIYRDLAPLDSIIQAAGRCNRNSDGERGIVKVVSLVGENNVRFSKLYDPILIQSTKNVLENKIFVPENEFNINSSTEYYEDLLKYGSLADSESLLDDLKVLNFKKIPNDFVLIENFDKTDVFVEIDGYSSELWCRFKENRKIKDSIERKNDFLSFKSNLYEYIVSVYTSQLGTIIPENQWLTLIPKRYVSRKYDLETGFIYSDDEEKFFV